MKTLTGTTTKIQLVIYRCINMNVHINIINDTTIELPDSVPSDLTSYIRGVFKEPL